MLALGVPDTLDGRFELVTLHVALLLRRVSEGVGAKRAGARGWWDLFVADMDRNLREMGAGRPFGRKKGEAYGVGLLRPAGRLWRGARPGTADLAAAAERNLYGTLDAEPGLPERAAAYIRAVEAALAAQEDARLAAGAAHFPEAPPC